MKNLKGFRKLFALAVSAVMLAFLPNANALPASAEEPTTYYVMYSESDEDWRYQLGSEWDGSAQSSPSQGMFDNIKNGDTVIIGNGYPAMLTFNVHLRNLTICNTSDTLAKVTVTGGIDNCDFVKGSLASVTGNVTNANVHGNATANFNDNVSNLYSYQYDSEAGPNIGTLGTVAYFKGQNNSENEISYGTNFQAGSFQMENGKLTTDPSKYTRGETGAPVPSSAQNTAPAAPKATAAPSGSSSVSDEYDAVPKTGEASPIVWLSLTAAACISASLILKRSAK